MRGESRNKSVKGVVMQKNEHISNWVNIKSQVYFKNEAYTHHIKCFAFHLASIWLLFVEHYYLCDTLNTCSYLKISGGKNKK